MSDQELLKDTSSAAILDTSVYSSESYPQEYLPDSRSSCAGSTEGFKSIRISAGQTTPQDIVVHISAKLISRRDRIRQINEAIKRSSVAD